MQTETLSSRLSKLTNTPSKDSFETDNPRDHDGVALLRDLQNRTRIYDRIGSSLMSTPLFQNCCLTLYCGVPVKHLLPKDHPPVHEALDFVICRGREALAAVMLVETDLTPQLITEMSEIFQKAGVPPGFLKFIQSDSFVEGLFFDHGDNSDWVAQFVIAPSLDLSENVPPVKSSLRPIPIKLLKTLSAPSVKALFAEKQDKKKSWYPTEYGRSLGIFQGFRIDENRRIHPLLCCAEESLVLLQQTASWGENGPPEPPKEPLSLSRRMELMNRGIPSNVAAVMNLVQSFGEMPLEEYFRDNQHALNAFRQTFPDACNYQQAAAYIEKFRSRSGDCIWDQTWTQRLAGPLVRRADISFSRQSLRSVLMAASFLAKSRYLVWEGEIIITENDPNHVAKNWSYREWLQWAFRCLKELDDKKDDSINPDNIRFFNEFIYRLAIRPFSMIQDQQAQKALDSN